MRSSSGTRPPRQLVVGVAQAAAGQHLPPLLDREHELRRILARERTDVAPVDGCHRSHVAGAEALELANLHALEADVLGGLLDGVVDLDSLPQVARDGGADVEVTRADR